MKKCIVCLSIALVVLSCGKSGTDGAEEFDRDIPGTIPGVFSVGEGKRVKFSKGNLWCECKGTNEHPTIVSWHFEEHQYDCTPSIITQEETKMAERDSTHISHFTWCDSAEKAVSLHYNDIWRSDTEFFAAHGFEVEGQSCWRVLTAEEWEHLVNQRKCSTVNGMENARYFRGNVEGICGLFIFPDRFEWPAGIEIPANINVWDLDYEYYLNLSSFDHLESKGLLFLPAAGLRNGAPNMYSYACMVGFSMDYCSSSPYPNSNNSMFYAISLGSNGVGIGGRAKYFAVPVRLIADV